MTEVLLFHFNFFWLDKKNRTPRYHRGEHLVRLRRSGDIPQLEANIQHIFKNSKFFSKKI